MVAIAMAASLTGGMTAAYAVPRAAAARASDAAARASDGVLPGPGKGKGKGRLTAPGQNKPHPSRPAPTTPVPTTPVPTQTPTTPVPTTPVPTTPVPTTPAPAEGFVPVREVRDYVAGVAVADGELWLVTGAPGQPLVLEHHVGDTVTRETLTATGGVAFAAAGRSDVWLAVGDQLRHYDGTAWSTSPLPADVAALGVRTLAVDGSGKLFVGTSGRMPEGLGHIYLSAGGTWTDLGHPDVAQYEFQPEKIVVTARGIAVFATGYTTFVGYDIVTGAWTSRVLLQHLRAGDIGGFVVLPDGRHEAFGYGLSWIGAPAGAPICAEYLAGGTMLTCTTTVVATDAETRNDGTVVIAGRDWTRLLDVTDHPITEDVPGRFVLRAGDGTETVVPGDPGGRTDLLAVPGGRTVYAVSRSRTDVTSFTLQRYAG